jgi:type IV pilus assembly protein PilO
MSSSAKKAPFDVFIDTKYLVLDEKIKIFISIGAFLLPTLLFYFFLLSPQIDKIKSLQKKEAIAQEELKKVRRSARDLPKHQKEFEETEQEFEAMSVLLPKSQEIPNLLRNISDLGKSAGLDFLIFTPGVETQKDFYAEIPIDIQIRGPYHNLGLFLDKVSKLERIVTVNNIQMDSPQQEGSEFLLNSSCRLLTYRFTNKKLEVSQKKSK